MSPNLLSCGLLLAIIFHLGFSSNLVPRQTCTAGYSLCSPPGANGDDTYDIGVDLLHFYENLLKTINPQAAAPGSSITSVNPNGPAKRQVINIMCCASGLSCLLLVNAGVPICYDRFTTDYALPNGDYGTVSNGTLITSSGVQVNLISGNYSVPNGQTGNIYSSATSDKPNTATMPIPTQYTSSGAVPAVPASQLGSSAGYTSSVATTISAETVASSDLSLSGPAVTPCSSCCKACGRPSTTIIGTTLPSITAIPVGPETETRSLSSYITGTASAAITPPITHGAGTKLQSFLKGVQLGHPIGAVAAILLCDQFLNSHY